ncbi:Lactonase, 7-bladed beta-propeller-domain-containing protein [Colletotrichum navitas]|uniref:Lactonase, 7-bladed beta-propeller-domain-containing protein n=1 Tax=Colletotrichum navitas TaxID=681940 RepID=A0AAD8V967_9PEZI|nr:Lactonase, 7-bladed beta-propeller-domain-containing protein [Colletotrichum navitas]KAK1598967.1 Lactonase, 7-bladed beta-propeller-domain-containing protein [Colletotrichum navitas]
MQHSLQVPSFVVLYCLDSGSDSLPNGSLNSFSIGGGGVLTRITRVSAPFSDVAGNLVTTESGARGYVSASYWPIKFTFLGRNRSAAGVFALSHDGALPGNGPLKSSPRPSRHLARVPSLQDTSYLHHVIIDPKNQYVLLADPGGDRVRVYTKDPTSIAPIKEVDGLATAPSASPRHGVFKTATNGEVFFFFVNSELDRNIYLYRLRYNESGLAFTEIFSIPAINPDCPATKAPTSEIAITNIRSVFIRKRDLASGKIIAEAEGGKVGQITLAGTVVATSFDED